jgi:hypothetical protein
MLERARLKPGSGFRLTRSALYYCQRLVPHPGPRRAVSRAIAAGINLRHGTAGAGARSGDEPTSPLAITAQQTETLAALDRDGYALTDPLLTAAMLADVASFLRDQDTVDAHGRRFRMTDRPPGTTMASYPLEIVLRCPHILKLANDPAVLGVATAYLRCRPTLSSIGIRWSFPVHTGDGAAATDIQRFHRDPDDWRFLKLFVYLTDIDAGAGPHEFIAGSHRTGGRVFERPYTDEEIERQHGSGSVRTIIGPRGTSFFADTYGIHRGAVPTSAPRLLLQFQYSILPVFAFRYRPAPAAIMPDPASIDRYVSRLLVA